MICCKNLVDGVVQEIPFVRVLAYDYWDGPLEGFAECAICRRAYTFRKLDWDNQENTRIFAFKTIDIGFDAIYSTLFGDLDNSKEYYLVPPLPEGKKDFANGLLNTKGNAWITAIERWPGKLAIWRNMSEEQQSEIKDWLTFLGINRDNPDD